MPSPGVWFEVVQGTSYWFGTLCPYYSTSDAHPKWSFWLSLLWKESKSTHRNFAKVTPMCWVRTAGMFRSLKPVWVCRCSLRIPNTFRVFLRTQSLVLWKVLEGKKRAVTSAKWSWKSRYSLGKKPKMLAQFLNLTGEFLKICTKCYCRNVT